MRTFAEFMLIAEGMTMKDFKQQRSRQKQKEKRAADKIAPNRRKDIHTDRYSPERAARHRANVDPDFEGNDERNYPGGKLNPKKVRKAKALGELGEGLDKKFGSMRKRGGRSAPPEERSVGGEMNRKNKDYWADMGGPNRDRGKGSKAKRRSAELGEAYDKEVMSSSQIRRTGEGGRIGAERKKTEPEKRRMRAAGGGKMEPAKTYKPRKDIGQQRQASTRVQQPEQERGSARERQLAAAKEERRKAAQARAAAKKSGETATAAAKPSAKEAEKTASKLLSKKKAAAAPAPGYTPRKASGLTAQERDKKVRRPGERRLRDLVLQATGKKSESELKHPITAKEISRRNAEAKKKG